MEIKMNAEDMLTLARDGMNVEILKDSIMQEMKQVALLGEIFTEREFNSNVTTQMKHELRNWLLSKNYYCELLNGENTIYVRW